MLQFKHRLATVNPLVVLMTQDPKHNIQKFFPGIASGRFYRVRPENEREVMYLQSLEHRVDKHAPADGDGVIVAKDKIDQVSR